ncbi:MAG: hypothetical protein II135_11675 [Clostridia bacterium]|nr:hypothetical protein [Clostridia bacterium]
MKRIISVLILISIFTGLFSVGFEADTFEGVVLTAETEGGVSGREMTVTLNLDSNPGFMFLRITPVYDGDILTLTGVSKEGADVVYDGLDFAKNIVIDSASEITGTGKLAVLTFSISPDAGFCTTEIGFTVRECINEAEEDVAFSEVTPVTAQISATTLTVGTGEGVIDGTVDIDITVENNPGICLIQMIPSFPEFMLLQDVTSDVFSNCTIDTNVILDNGADVTGDGVIATLHFVITDQAAKGAYPISVTLSGVYDHDENEVTARALDGSVTVTCDHHRTEIRNAVKETCTEPGATGDEYCVLCGELLKAGTEIPPAGHSFGDPVFVWYDDNAKATATFACSECTAVEAFDAQITSVTVPATCTSSGTTEYTASVEFNGTVYTDKKTVEIPASGHVYGEPEFCWFEDYSSATALFTCSECEDVLTLDAVVTARISEPTCTEKGEVVYTAYVEFNGEKYYDTQRHDIDPKGHSFGEPVFSWSEDHKTADASFKCAVCQETVTVGATVSEETKIVRDEEKALNVSVFKATVEYKETVYTETVEIVNFRYGDVNGDGVVNGRDLIRLRKHLNGEEVEIFGGSDCTGDGKLNGQDLIRLRKFLASENDLSLLGPKE